MLSWILKIKIKLKIKKKIKFCLIITYGASFVETRKKFQIWRRMKDLLTTWATIGCSAQMGDTLNSLWLWFE